jgi:hypothetical protein
VEGTEEGREAACGEKSIFRVADEKIVLGFLPSVMVSHILTFWGWVQKEQQQHQEHQQHKHQEQQQQKVSNVSKGFMNL